MKFDHEILSRAIVRMKTHRNVPAFFFDFDGTLVRIMPRPEEVRFRTIVRHELEDLAEEFTVGIISGRRLDELKRLVGIKGIYYSGNHGVEIEGPRMKFVEPRSAKSSAYISSLGKEIAYALRDFHTLISMKNYSVSVHYRNIEPGRVKDLLSRFYEVVNEPLSKRRIDVFHGKKVVEIKSPVDWDKGDAIEMISRRAGRRCLPIFFGDDTTDEFGFEKVNELGGISVFVGKRHRGTNARYWVKSPSELIGELAKFLFET